MPVQGMFDILPLEVTPEAGEGTLGTWRFPNRPPGIDLGAYGVLKGGTSFDRKPRLCGA